ncbi:hypothetical protein DM01DRAFT_1333160 [Hesseltinella vesiculosa]|uniref:Nucleotide-diphospho-sugar transferase n=1 Tax=Hesseltinella vesiculosa TaxID=101127 RepID=A0A1X2GRI6_9FUNG|nr:hypothetical protein DM01DRAFT_1333160 [Hesseltinella vesiculosa]
MGMNSEANWMNLPPGQTTNCLTSHCRNAIALRLESGTKTMALQIKELISHDQQMDEELVLTWINESLDDERVSLVSQFTVNRLSVFANVVETWSGPISVTIYLTEPTDIDSLLDYLDDPRHMDLYSRVTVTLVKPNYQETKDRRQYPINHLRNLAVLASTTPFVFVMDADFTPSPTLWDSIQALPLTSSASLPRIAHVVPCFAVKEENEGLPATMSDLKLWVQQERAYITDPGAGHGPTLGKEMALTWANILSDRSLPSTFEVCYESQWEPYYVVPRHAPLYDVRFKDQGGDKQSHALHLNAERFQFLVMRHEFIVHKDHPKLVWPGQGFPEAQKDALRWNYFDGFMQEIESLYGHLARWPHGCSALATGWQDQRRSLLGMAVGAV